MRSNGVGHGGQSIGGYEVVREVARGGMGVVHEVVDPRTGAHRALKIMQVAGAEDLLRFDREAQLLARLDHPAVVRIHAAGAEGGAPYLVMDLLAGGSLQERLDRGGPLPPGEAARITAELARGVAHAHAHGVLHRDLKPRNVVFDAPGPEGRAKLVDFGLARLLRDEAARLTATGVVLGTPDCMSPEQAAGLAVDERTDVHGLGTLLYTLLTGRAPYHGPTIVAVVAAAVRGAPPSPAALRPGLPPDLVAICARAMARDPGRRFESAAALADALEATLVPARTAGRRAAPLIAAALLVLVAAALGPALMAASAPPVDVPAATPAPAPPLASSTALPDARWSELEGAIAASDPGGATAALASCLEVGARGPDVDLLRQAAAVVDAPQEAPTDARRLVVTRSLIELDRDRARLERRDPEEVDAFLAPDTFERWRELARAAQGTLARSAGARTLERVIARRVLHVVGRALLVLELHPGCSPSLGEDGDVMKEEARRLAALGVDPAPLALTTAWVDQDKLHERGPADLPGLEALPPSLRPHLIALRVHARAPMPLADAVEALAWAERQSPQVRATQVLCRRLQRELGRLHRREAWAALLRGADPTSPGVARSLERARELGLLAARTDDGSSRNRSAERLELVITLLLSRDGGVKWTAVERELDQFAPGATTSGRLGLLRVELELARGAPGAALLLLDQLGFDRLPRREALLARAHARRLTGDSAWQDDLAAGLAAPRAAQELAFDWREPEHAEGVVRGTLWWPGTR